MMSFTPEGLSRKSGLGVIPSPAPFLTPRIERRRPDSFSSRIDRDSKEVNVQVILRCRPFSEEEHKSNVPRAISCNEMTREVNVLHSVANKQIDRAFNFDKVFGPKSQQRSIYDQAIAPIVHEVLEGFSCTVFAYGQTGTGKTYTMEGGMRKKLPLGGDLPAEAGVIPRAVRHIFDTLELQNADYCMKVTFLELYNEELTDLLAQDDSPRFSEDKQKKPISLMEDGKGSVVLRGLEEEVVYSANDIYALLERGSSRRRTADTLLNKRSSRSHSVFTITVHIKEESMGDEELIKCGKLNLVDLAGSENISRSGARDGRAREAGEINKSLLTLGRVINALVEHSSHIPYRDSKLTRLLRDSLGGKTKTCIIATISPSAHSLEETLSTLDYAYRAKNIKNKPEANQKLSKAVLLKDLYLELERMKEDVRAARNKNGVYIAQERYAQEESEKKARIERIEQLENELNLSETEVSKFRDLYEIEKEKLLDVESDLKDCKRNLHNSNKELLELKENYIQVISKLKEREVIISKMKASENSLIDRAKGLRSDLLHASDDISSLFTRLDQKDKLESKNQNMLLKFGSQLDQNLKDLHRTVLGSVSQQQQQLRTMEEQTHSFLAHKYDATRYFESKIEETANTFTSGVADLKELSEMLKKKAFSDLEKTNSSIVSQIEAVEKFLTTSVTEAVKVSRETQNLLNDQKKLLALAARQEEQSLVRSMRSAQEITNATSTIFSNIYNQAHCVVETIRDSQAEKSRQLAAFEMKFKEEAEREEKQALNDISVILSKLTSKKTAMVYDASRNIREHDVQEEKILYEQMTGMQQVSVGAKEELCDYLKIAKNHFTESTIASAESTTVMDSYLQECLGRADESEKLWEITERGIKNINTKYQQELNAQMGDMAKENEKVHHEFASTFSLMDANFVSQTTKLHAAVNDSLMKDRENKETMDAIVETCMNQVTSLQENHGQTVSNIRNKAEQCLIKDYQVDQHKNETPKKQSITVPSLGSNQMKTANRYTTTLSMFRISMLLLSCLFTLVSAQGPGFVSLDCGGDSPFTDQLGLKWSPDHLNYGQAAKVSIPTRSETQYMSLRHFPADSGKYCYTLNVTRNNRYLLRASFLYGNFDNNSVNPRFSIYIGSTYWATIAISDASKVETAELVFLATNTSVSVCLSNATSGQPFISTLELRQLDSDMYYTAFAKRFYMSVVARINFGAESEDSVRYPDDPFDRIWESDLKANHLVDDTALGTVRRVSTTLPIKTGNSIRENPPQKVMQTAVVGANGSLAYHLKLDGFPGSAWLYTCFAEIEDLADDESRRFKLVLPDQPPKDLPDDIHNFQTAYRDFEAGFPNITLPLVYKFGFVKTLDSSKGPILNAMEILKHLPITDVPVDITKQKGGDKDSASVIIIIALVCAAIVLLAVIGCCIYLICKCKDSSEPSGVPSAELDTTFSDVAEQDTSFSNVAEEVTASSADNFSNVAEAGSGSAVASSSGDNFSQVPTSSSSHVGEITTSSNEPTSLSGPIYGR